VVLTLLEAAAVHGELLETAAVVIRDADTTAMRVD
jgi:hypothetical protein